MQAIAHSERLLAVVGPSGAGKDSVLNAWRALLRSSAPGGPATPHHARRVITRAADPDGEAHEPVDEATFIALRSAGELALHWQAHGLLYGVRSCDLQPLQQGRWVVVNASRAHLPALRAVAPAARVVEITAPAPLLAQRLARRAREGAAAVQERLAREVPPSHADLVVHNTGDVLAAALRLQVWWRGVSRAR
jgi:ribose 1,5-bisphosphokinase